MELLDHVAFIAGSSLISISIAARATSRPFILSAASSTATSLLSLGGMVHPTEPNAGPVQHR